VGNNSLDAGDLFNSHSTKKERFNTISKSKMISRRQGGMGGWNHRCFIQGRQSRRNHEHPEGLGCPISRSSCLKSLKISSWTIWRPGSLGRKNPDPKI